ncbi:MAG: hypothetical protein ACYC5G_04555 [Candidatus Doudnabacteria bacterium]
MSYPKITAAQVNAKGFDGNFDTPLALELLQNLSFNQVTNALAAGATGVTVNEHVFVAPTKLEITGVNFITTAVNTGASNEPAVKLLSGADEVGTATILLAGSAIGNVAALTLDATKVVVAAGTKLIFRIVNPTATITTALAGKLQIEWKSVV